MVENEHPLSEEILPLIKPDSTIPIIGITGPPGAGKSTLVDALIKKLVDADKKVAVLAIDPSSPFNQGALLGDRIRMSSSFIHPGVFIRSMASRGSLGGLAAKAIEITDVMRSCGFDIILVETVGVGQSEIDIIGLADLTVVVLVPESGDEIQQAKSGLMEIADIFVLNKSDREGADSFANHLKKMLKQKNSTIPLIKTVADKSIGIDALLLSFDQHHYKSNKHRRLDLLTEKAWRLIQQKKMRGIDKGKLRAVLEGPANSDNFNLYRFVKENY
jgi:LAO/AO transport system kinase